MPTITVDTSELAESLIDGGVLTTFVVERTEEFELSESGNTKVDLGDWLRDWRNKLVLIPGASLIPSVISSVSIGNLSDITKDQFLAWIFGAHILVLVVLLFILPKMNLPRRLPLRVTISCEQFRTVWQLIWTSWLVLYIFLFLQKLSAINGATEDIFDYFPVIENFLNNLTTLLLVLLYFVLAKRTTDLSHRNGNQWNLPIVQLSALLILWTSIEILFLVLHIDAGHIFGIISGLAAGLAMALIVGRLDSAFVGLPTAIVLLMYSYAVIQPAWGWFELTQPAFYLVALCLKVVFFMVTSWLMDSGMLSYYMQSIATISAEARLDKEKFFQGRMQRRSV